MEATDVIKRPIITEASMLAMDETITHTVVVKVNLQSDAKRQLLLGVNLLLVLRRAARKLNQAS